MPNQTYQPNYGQRPYRGQRRNYQPQQPYQAKPMPPQVAIKPAVKSQTFLKGPKDLWLPLQIVKDEQSNTTKTTRAMRVPGGLLINTVTRGATFAAEAIVYLPGADVVRTANDWAIVGRAEG